MPSQDERLETIEREFWQFKSETKDAYEEMALEITMFKGLAEDSVKRLIKLERTIDQRFNKVDQRLETLEHDMSEMKAVQNEHTALLTQILERLPTSR